MPKTQLSSKRADNSLIKRYEIVKRVLPPWCVPILKRKEKISDTVVEFKT